MRLIKGIGAASSQVHVHVRDLVWAAGPGRTKSAAETFRRRAGVRLAITLVQKKASPHLQMSYDDVHKAGLLPNDVTGHVRQSLRIQLRRILTGAMLTAIVT